MGFNIMDLMNGATRAAVEGVDNYEAITLNLDEIKVTKHNRYSMDDLEELATSILMPQKGVFEAIKDVEANGTGEDADTSTIYNLVAAVLNNNMGNVKVSAEEVESYDIEECTAILNAYMEFVDELKANPN